MAIDLKAASPDTTIPATGAFLFGADSQAAAAPSVYRIDTTVLQYLNSLAHTITVNGALSAPATSLTGTWITGGSATTTKPQFLIEPSGTTSTGWSTAGTGIGVNAPSGFTGNLIDLKLAGTSKFTIDYTGAIVGGASLSNMTDTWSNPATVYAGIKLEVTDTGSDTSSKLIDLVLNSSSLFFVRKDGSLFTQYGNFASYVTCTGNIQILTNSASLIYLGTSLDTIIGRAAAASLQFGGADAATSIAQSFQVQSVAAGTSNTAGSDWTFKAAKGTGTGQGGGFVWQTAKAGSSGSAQNSLSTAFSIDAPGNVIVGNAALATNATDGFLYAPSSAGAPSGTPTTKTGRVPMQFDTTNGRLYAYYGGAWHQVGLT